MKKINSKLVYSRKDIIDGLRSVGVRLGDNLFVTSSLGMFGLLKGATNIDEVNEAFFSSLCESVGSEGSIIVPTYSYSFGKHTISSPVTFKVLSTESEIGPFPEFFRKQKGVVRSNDPFMSVAIKGPLAKVLDNLTPTSYGHDCIFERFLLQDVICLNLGLGPNWMAFIHYADYLARSPFRYDKLFSGKFENSVKVQQWLYSVPLLSNEARANAHAVGAKAEQEKIWSFSELGRGRIYKAGYDQYFNFVMDELKHDNWALAEGVACDIKSLEVERCGILTSDKAKGGAITYFTNKLVTDAAKDYGLVQDTFDTGTNAFDHIIPEGWYLSNVSIINSSGKNIEQGEVEVQPYSLGFHGRVSRESLKQHLKLSRSLPPYIERDWCISMDANLLSDSDYYDIEINCGTYFSHAVAAFKKRSLRVIHVISATDIVNHHEWYLKTMAKLVNSPMTTLIVSHETGLVAWLAKYQTEVSFNEEIRLLCPSRSSTWLKWDKQGYNPVAKQTLLDQKFNFSIANS